MTDFSMRRVWGPTPKYPLVMAYEPPTKSKDLIVIAGPCSVESEGQIEDLAELVAQSGATHLRGGVFRAGTYPGKNFGFIEESLLIAYSKAAKRHSLKNIIEVLDYEDSSLDLVCEYATHLQVGCRQMQNYQLLRILGRIGKPIFLKRHPGSTMDEWLGAAEWLLKSGCEELYLIERGSSSHLNHTRWDLSISIIPAVKAICKIPVICDASHGTGRRDLVGPMALAGVAAGAAGILTEVHEQPDESLSDPDQAITPVEFRRIVEQALKINKIVKGD